MADELGAVGEFISYLGTMSALLSAPKRASIDALALEPGDAALDVGCGVGGEVQSLSAVVGPTGRAVGIDLSDALVEAARARTPPGPGVELLVADAHAMPFDDDEFDAARVERTLQHMTDPASVVAEMARVVRHDGRVVAMEPDWDTLVVSGASLELTRAIVRACADRIRHPDAGRLLPEWFVGAGIETVRVDALAMPIRSVAVAEHVFDLQATVESIGTPIAQAWLDDLSTRESRGTFVAAATGFGVLGVVR
jgi:SAM-dependent methyltransferase